MARQVWWRPEVVEASGEVVMLAVHRQEAAPGDIGGFGAPDWVVRLNVLAYPQVRVLDGWGVDLDPEGHLSWVREVDDTVAALQAVSSKRPSRRPSLQLPPALRSLKPPAGENLRAPLPYERARAWHAVLEAGPPSERQALALMEWESDPVVRLDLLLHVAEADEPAGLEALIERAAFDPNDHVRAAALARIEHIEPTTAARILGELILAVRTGNTHFSNPNNVLCAATAACAKVPDRSLIAPLGAIVTAGEGNNSATLFAVQALVAIGREHGVECVRAPLERALDIEGSLAKRIREVANELLGDS